MKPRYYLFELACWVGALVMLSLSEPHHPHFSLCPLARLGISWCPGCGLGRSLECILHGDFLLSFHYHWLGYPVLAVLVFRIFELSKKCLVSFSHKPTS